MKRATGLAGLLGAAMVVMTVLATGTAYAGASNSITVKNASASIVLDGRLDEPAWQHAAVMKLVQQSPRPGEPSPYETEVRVLLSGDRLYFGFLCRDPEPNKIAVHTMQRDGMMRGDDTDRKSVV